ncbi:DUF234 domain-containing protein [Parashewanella spongiae]|nr:DUF234 domain-containing protein [Parashewanella spongiae]
MMESNQFDRIGGYWDSKGKNEIDIVAINDKRSPDTQL